MKMLVPIEMIENKIFLIRNQKVMVDVDLAQLYGVSTSQFNRAIKRNVGRFPFDFMFQLNKTEYISLRCQFGISMYPNKIKGGRRYLPYVFTEQGIAMLSGILNSRKAVQVNTKSLFDAIRALMNSDNKKKKKIGFLQ